MRICRGVCRFFSGMVLTAAVMIGRDDALERARARVHLR